MRFFKIVTLFFLMVVIVNINAQDNQAQIWNNHKCAVALTYDDGLNVHLDKVIPVLDSAGFKGTFYIPGNAVPFDLRLDEWRTAAANGHELGNHTLFHPCAGKSKGREWVQPDYDLDNYTITQIVDEIRMENVLLKAVDGKSERTFAYTCGDMSVGDSLFTGLIYNDFIAARSVESRMEKLETIDLFNIGSYMINEQSGKELITLVQEAEAKGALLVFLFHGVGGEHHLNVALEEHNKLIDYLKTNEKDIWVAPLVEISEFIINNREIPNNK
ncbi:MAG: polysaccharide deacetylase family protein [Bacteroidales bacterium]|nr:polysaccharide deacetylase family protein [Bacteroidales bacterium]